MPAAAYFSNRLKLPSTAEVTVMSPIPELAVRDSSPSVFRWGVS